MNFLDRFLKYVSFDTTSYDEKENEASSPNQYELGKELVKQLKDLGVDEVSVNKFGTVHGYFEGEKDLEPIALIAHMDTSNAAKGGPIKPRIIDNYDGKDIVLSEGVTMKTSDFPSLLGNIGHKLIVTDGTTLLGADDKAGIAIAMEVVSYFVTNKIKHRPIEVVFSTDEEIGAGADHIDISELKSKFGYTIDGGDIRYINIENFNAASMEVSFTGRSIHPGDAKNKMINAINVAFNFHDSLPKCLRPEHTEDHEGFYHLLEVNGNEEKAHLSYIVREHDLNKLRHMIEIAKLSEKIINESYGEGVCKVDVKESYYNMYDKIQDNYEVVERIVNIYKEMNLPLEFEAIRGGTDGATLTNRNYPCPNIGNGGYNFHGRFEYLDVTQAMTMIEIVKKLFVVR